MKRFAGIVLSLLMAFGTIWSLAGCNQQTNQPSSSKNEVTICVDSTHQEIYEPMFRRFEEETGYKVDPIWTADLTNVQDTRIGARNYPDIIVGGDLHLEKYARILMDLRFLQDDESYALDDFYDNLLDPLEKDGKLLFVPRYFNTGVLYYNTDVITDANDYPTADWKYEDFYATAQKYSRNLGSANEESRTYGVALDNHYWSEWATLVRQAGGKLMDDDGYISLDTDAAKRGIELFAKNSYGFIGDNVYTGALNEEGASDKEVYITVNAGAGARISPNGLEKNFQGFGSKRYAFQYGGHTQNIPVYRKMGVNFDVALLPQVQRADGTYSRNGGELSIDALGIYKNTQAYDAAVAFIKFMTGQAGIRLHANSGYMPPRKSIAAELLAVPKAERAAPKNLEVIFDSIEYNEILPNKSYFVEIMQTYVQPQFGSMMNKVMSVDNVAKKATEEANQAIDLQFK